MCHYGFDCATNKLKLAPLLVAFVLWNCLLPCCCKSACILCVRADSAIEYRVDFLARNTDKMHTLHFRSHQEYIRRFFMNVEVAIFWCLHKTYAILEIEILLLF